MGRVAELCVLAAALSEGHAGRVHGRIALRATDVTLSVRPISMSAKPGLPAPVVQALPALALQDIKAVLPLWNALRRCYPTEEAAIDAVRANTGLCLPWVSSASKIEGSYAVLVDICGKEAALEVITKNPGALGNDPLRLKASSPNEIMAVANLVATAGALKVPFTLLALLCLSTVVFAPEASLAAFARPTVGTIGAGSFAGAAAMALYAASRLSKEG
ncbi:hypothetical protein AB1Y20_009715 [Prymnesium parvum]|uniref:Uncharacterized protein n=1 Tax=Prymnesium parvum TaxID=97485 RepID=A0AB34K5B1_PRYPA